MTISAGANSSMLPPKSGPLRSYTVTSTDTLQPPLKSAAGRLLEAEARKNGESKTVDASRRGSLGRALTDTPNSTAPSSPSLKPTRKDSGSSTPRIRPTTLDVPGLTKSKVSPDGRISSRDIGSKLVIVMVGLPARGKSYITKKIARYLNWLQHDTRIFNVGERRRIAAGGPVRHNPADQNTGDGRSGTARALPKDANAPKSDERPPPRTTYSPASAARILLNGEPHEPAEQSLPNFEALPPPAQQSRALPDGNGQMPNSGSSLPSLEGPMDQSASFFDPANTKASQIREQVALATLDELLDYILDQGGSVGILDATNSTLSRRKAVLQRVRERAGPELGVLFLESLCLDKDLLESNIRLKLSGPDYKGQDPKTALADFKKRIEIYERNYVPLGAYEEANNVQYIQMIDVGRKIVSHQIHGFLAAQAVYYLVNFNLSPRQIWITRHGESIDNLCGRIGGNSELSEGGRRYARALARFMTHQREIWTVKQQQKAAVSGLMVPRPGDGTPPYALSTDAAAADKNFCVWTSMLKRSVQSAEWFDEDEFDVKQMRMLDELSVGNLDGMTYDEIRTKYADEYEQRKLDRLHYRYPGSGESYLDLVHRLQPVIVEVERMTDHVLLLCHRSVSRVLLAYFLGLNREAITDVDVPLGVVYMLEPKPYGVAFKAFRYDAADDSFHYEPHYRLSRSPDTHD